MSDSHPLVCRFGALGDMVLITPLLKQLYLRSGLPCDIVGIGGWNRLLFAEMPWVRHVFTIDSRSAPYWFNRSQQALVARLKAKDHRYSWICETNKKSYRLLARAGITRDSSVCQPDLAPIANEHYVDKWLRLGALSPPGFDRPAQTLEPDTELFVSAAEIEECRQWLQSRAIDPEAPLITIHAGSKRTTRRGRADRSSNTKWWPERNWAEVIDSIIAALPAAQVFLCGVPAELNICRAIQSECKAAASVHVIVDDLPLRRLLALLSLAHSCISVDTGPAHIAAALNCPLTVLFGQSNPARFRPLSANSPVQVLVGKSTNGNDGEVDIGYITPQQVLDAWLSPGIRQQTLIPGEKHEFR